MNASLTAAKALLRRAGLQRQAADALGNLLTGVETMRGSYEGLFQYGHYIDLPDIVVEEDEMLVRAVGRIEITSVDFAGRPELTVNVGALPFNQTLAALNLIVEASYDDDGVRGVEIDADNPAYERAYWVPGPWIPPGQEGQSRPPFGDGNAARFIGWADDGNSAISAVSSQGRMSVVAQKIKVPLP